MKLLKFSIKIIECIYSILIIILGCVIFSLGILQDEDNEII